MRLIHTSDWHIGRSLHGVDLLEAQARVLRQIVDVVATPADGIGVDAVLISGDIYDRAVPPVEAVTLLARVISELCAHATVIMTSGNHDSAIRLGFGADLYTDRLHIRTDLTSVGVPVVVGNTAIYPLPYLDPDAARIVLGESGEPLGRSHQAVVSAAMDRVRVDLASRAGMRSIVMAHAFVVGGIASDSERPILVGGVDSVAASTFDGVDYVALGHLHGSQSIGASPSVRYSGSPLRYSFSERHHTKSVTMVDLDPEGGVTCSEIALDQPRRMVELSGELSELLDGIAAAEYVDDWVRITVTDRARPENLYARVKHRYPHVLQINHVPAGYQSPIGAAGPVAGTGAGVPVAITAKAMRELGSDFIRHVTGVDASTDELDLIQATYDDVIAELAATP